MVHILVCFMKMLLNVTRRVKQLSMKNHENIGPIAHNIQIDYVLKIALLNINFAPKHKKYENTLRRQIFWIKTDGEKSNCLMFMFITQCSRPQGQKKVQGQGAHAYKTIASQTRILLFSLSILFSYTTKIPK